jgi:copper homeostasis protein (lipoprotein)
MRTRIAILAIIAAAVSLSACFSNVMTPAASQPPDMHTSQTSLDWHGTYAGVVPCADCAGIETFITINEDLSYHVRTRYLGKDDRVFEHQGSFTWEESGNVIHLKDFSEGPDRYHVGENLLFQLDKQGERITGDLAEKYILRKLASGKTAAPYELFLSSQWRLTELAGKQIDQEVGVRQLPWMRFEMEGGRVYGFAGCNRFSGTFELAEGKRIRFSRMAVTKMACPNMNVETEFLKVMETADSYRLHDQEMVLLRASMTPLAKFRALVD